MRREAHLLSDLDCSAASLMSPLASRTCPVSGTDGPNRLFFSSLPSILPHVPPSRSWADPFFSSPPPSTPTPSSACDACLLAGGERRVEAKTGS